MSDLISRQAAINALEELKELDYELYIRTSYSHLMEDQWDFVIKRYKEAIKETPCAQQKTGRWIFEKGDGKTCVDGYICSACGESFHTKVPYWSEFKFCPCCGARMEETENE